MLHATTADMCQAGLAALDECIAAGDIEQFAMRIAENPKDIRAVMESVREERDINRRHAIDFFSRLAESNLIERYELSDLIQETIMWLKESLERLVPDSDPPSLSGRRQRRALPPGRPGPPPASGGVDLPGDGGGGGWQRRPHRVRQLSEVLWEFYWDDQGAQSRPVA
jgi:hypothetical protein